ncbi:MAG: DUF5684 domain-containing protein [Actinomycetota bacterium]|nr:DUF5684 domain-containing protein [Actinomycetota bacterium]
MLASTSGALVALVVYLAVVAFEISALWKVFHKAGRPGWAAIVPVYNTYLLVKISGHSGWWVLLLLVPLLNLVLVVVVLHGLARSFGKGAGFTVGLVLLSPVFVPVLGFGPARYTRPAIR